MFPVGSFVKITDISECKKVELNEVFKVLSSSKAMTTIENKDGVNLGGYYSWRFVAADPVADATKTIIDDDWFVYDGTKFPNHILRAKTDWLRQKGSATWEIVTSSAGKIIAPHTTFEFRCKKSDAPTAEVAKPQVASATEDDWFYFDNTIHADHILRQDIDQIDYGGNDWIKINASAGIAIKGGGGYLKYRCKKCHAPKEIATTVAEGDWVIIDKSIYGEFKLRLTDECNYKNTKWMKVVNDCGNSYNHIYYKDYEFRCKRSDLPVVDTTKSQAAYAEKSQMADATKSPEVEPQKSTQFWTGQEIICNEKGLSLLTYNKAYTVLETNTLSSGFYVKVKGDKGVINQFLSSRFRVTDVTKSQVADTTKLQAAAPAITNLCVEVEQPPIAKKDTKMFPVGSFVKITDISNCGKVKLNEVFEVLYSNNSLTEIKNKDGINLGVFDTWRFVAAKSPVDETKITQQDTKMFSNKFQNGQTVICNEYESTKGRLTIGKGYVVIGNDPTNNGGHVDMIQLINNFGDKEWFFVYRFSAATAENTTVAEQPKRIVAKVTNNYLTKGQSYEVVDDGDGTTVIVGPNGCSLCFMDDCFESDISLSDVTNVDGATGTKENEMKKETAVKVASVVGKFVAGWGFRALNYWAIEPAVNIARPILSSVRYAGFLAAISMIGYGMYNPQAVKDAAYSCIPKISFSIEAPEILNGK